MIGAFGNIVNEETFTKQDTSYDFQFGFQKANGNFFIMGTLTDTVSLHNMDVSYFCELDTAFGLVWEKTYKLPAPYKNHQMLDFVLDADSNVLIEGRADFSEYSSNDDLFIAKINQNGDMQQFKLYEDWHDYGNYGVFMHNYDSTGYVLLGDFPQNSFVREWVELDQDLEITGFVSVIDLQHYIFTPASAKWLPNGNLIMANRANVEPGADEDLYVKVMDQDLNNLHDTLILYSNEPTYISVKNGMDYTDPNNIWLGTFYGVPPGFSWDEVFRIHIFDSNGNLKGRKVYGGDKSYWFFDLKATSDGGCIMTGMVGDYEGADNTNGYIIKVMSEDILTHAEETPFENDRDVAVFPNPFQDFLHFETMRKGLSVSISDNTGKEVLNINLNGISRKGIDMGYIPPGIYLYNILDNGRKIQGGKLIKQ
jgi:hypothetical protein